MINNNQTQKPLELQPMTNNGIQDDEDSYTEETIVVDNEFQQEFLKEGRRQKLLHKYVCRIEFLYNYLFMSLFIDHFGILFIK
jgi:hypothetical protein